MNPVAFHVRSFASFAALLLLCMSAVAQTNLVVETFPATGYRKIEVSPLTNRFNGQITITYTTNEFVWFKGTNESVVHISSTNMNERGVGKEKFNIKVELEKVPNGTPAPGEPVLLQHQPIPGRL